MSETNALPTVGARYSAEYALAGIERRLSNAAASQRWSSAALVAVNGGGAAAVLNASDKIVGITAPMILFGVGLIAAILGQVIAGRLEQRTADAMTRLYTYWRKVELHGGHDEEQMNALVAVALKHAPMVHLAWGSKLLSGLLFLIAGTISSQSVIVRPSSVEAICSSLERDMLLKRPARANSKEIFTALNCRVIW